MTFSFNIVDWQAFAPGVSGPEQWQRWSQHLHAIDPAAAPPKLSELPMMTARRLSSGSKLAVECGLAMLRRHEIDAVLYTSRHGELQFGRDVVFAAGAEETLNIDDPRGKLLLASHLGDVEACRALAQLQGSKTINALVFSDNAQRFKQIMAEMAPQAGLNLLPVTDIGPETAMLLQEKLDRGEWIAIVGDRIAVNPQRGGEWRVCWSRFMGLPAPFPQGPFILAAILRCPVNLMFALRQQGKLRIYCEPFADPLPLPRANRQQALQHIIDRYAERLEYYALQSPLDWFNFFDFWRLPEPKDKE